ncbi:MAG: glycosyltransferase family 4 protein, partial [Nitrospira sp.]
EVVLFARENPAQTEEPFAFYGVDASFRIERVSKDVTVRDGARYAAWHGTSCWRRSSRMRYVLNRANRYTWKALQNVKRLPLPDLFYARDRLALSAVADSGVPLVLESHKLPQKPIHIGAEQWLLHHRNLKRVVVISEALRRDYADMFPDFDSGKILVAPDGADLPTAEEVPLPATWPGRPGCRQIGYVGSLYAGKGMEIVSLLPPRMPEVDFHVVGGNAIDLAHWKARASFPNLYYHGQIPHALLSAYYHRLDIVLAPLQRRIMTHNKNDISRWTSPLKVFEYMANKKAIVASDLPVLREILHHDETAVLVPPEDVHAWEAAILRIMHDPVLRQALEQAAHELLVTRYTWKIRAKCVLEGLDLAKT